MALTFLLLRMHLEKNWAPGDGSQAELFQLVPETPAGI